ncbi:MAG: hypothetical protein R3194_12500 [Limnobacter sp.]|nr:hypothetical protein [Limnobacter sp.]
MKRFQSICIGLSALLSAGCVSQYSFSDPVTQQEKAESAVEVKAVNSSQSVFQRLKFLVTVRNQTGVDQPFSTRHVEARLNGERAIVLSYESQIYELRSIIEYYQPFVPEPASHVKPVYRGGQPVSMVFQPVVGSLNDVLDLRNALEDLEHVRANAVRPVTVKPGETYQGEITLRNKLNAAQKQLIELEVQFAGQNSVFQIQATELP